MIEATKPQVQHWIERQRAELERALASCDRALAMKAYREASPARTRLEKARGEVLVDMGVLETLWACHQRWQLAREGMMAYISDRIEPLAAKVKYFSGPMNAVANEMWGDLPHDGDGFVRDVTPVFDKMREVYENR